MDKAKNWERSEYMPKKCTWNWGCGSYQLSPIALGLSLLKSKAMKSDHSRKTTGASITDPSPPWTSYPVQQSNYDISFSLTEPTT